jgi:formylmethanofuran dehydrogenase subunit A
MLRIKGGKVYDPAHNINGVVQDICIDNGHSILLISEVRP